MKIFKGVERLTASIKDFFIRLSEIKEVKKLEKQKTITAYYADDNNILQTTTAKLSNNFEWAYIPAFKRVLKVDKIYRDEKLKPIIFFSLYNHKTLNLEELNNETIEFYNQAKKLVLTLDKDKLSNLPVSTDLRIKDNPISQEFSIDADRVFQTKSLEILEEPARRTILIMLLFGIAIGMIISFFVAYALLLWLK